MPENITPLFLPPYSPELNPIERLWASIKSHFLSNTAHADDQALLDAGCHAWDVLTPERLKSVCAVPWFTPGNRV
jgi:transposase